MTQGRDCEEVNILIRKQMMNACCYCMGSEYIF